MVLKAAIVHRADSEATSTSVENIDDDINNEDSYR